MDSIENNKRQKHPLDGAQLEEGGKKHKKQKKHHHSDDSASEPFQNITNLLKALDAALDEETTPSLIGDEALKRCLDLRTVLRAPKSPLKQQDEPNIPKTLTPASITPWKLDELPEDLPPLPVVLDKTLEEAAFTHTNTGGGRITDITYERLEWVGDSYMELVAALLIGQTFPHHTPGKLSQLRERCVKNLTLSEYATAYGFDKRANLGPNFKPSAKDMIKILGDMFEAYVAAIVLSDPENGLPRAAEWLKGLWGRTLAKEIREEEEKGIKIQNPMWKLVGEARDIIAQQKAPLPSKDQLTQAIGGRGVRIEYRDMGPPGKDRTNNLPLFSVGVYLTGWKERDKLLGRGSANGKKDAGIKAAEQALNNKKMMAIYMERKRMQDEQDRLDKEAVEQAKALSKT
ncbi:Ribonuclease [Lachnellula occidentalis]|uniref:Ribonuclease n=1 Tax=Lachnellula occidentalis TaxID=215460 RepID=A0A8H8S5R5_9HELO|nr:Ribonuclease [Lachnellula occidentalis]